MRVNNINIIHTPYCKSKREQNNSVSSSNIPFQGNLRGNLILPGSYTFVAAVLSMFAHSVYQKVSHPNDINFSELVAYQQKEYKKANKQVKKDSIEYIKAKVNLVSAEQKLRAIQEKVKDLPMKTFYDAQSYACNRGAYYVDKMDSEALQYFSFYETTNTLELYMTCKKAAEVLSKAEDEYNIASGKNLAESRANREEIKNKLIEIENEVEKYNKAASELDSIMSSQ